MRRFEIGSASMRAAAFVLLALGSIIGLGADRASAQYSYYFDFTATSSPSGNLPYAFYATITSSTPCTPCTLMSPSQLNGTELFGGNMYSIQAYPGGGDQKFSVTTGVGLDGLDYRDSNGDVYWEISQFESGPGSGGTESVSTQYGSIIEQGTLTYGVTTPAPVPGSGPLSYLALGLGGLFIYRKRLWRAARMAAGLAA
jgi:hypothetical protein